MKYWVYILYSGHLDKYYVGSTQDIEGRLQRHLAAHKGFTSHAKDWVLKYQEPFGTKSEAVKREFQIKKWKSRAMIERLISQS
ncbi:GIY-YIG nuclease family protein [Flagellimonas sp.]|uniref:GIY-YIG nuclease family protein n=1 Tax=Flagellimonas sp. TaxID=2058762 RepID=UPI003BAFBEDE